VVRGDIVEIPRQAPATSNPGSPGAAHLKAPRVQARRT